MVNIYKLFRFWLTNCQISIERSRKNAAKSLKFAKNGQKELKFHKFTASNKKTLPILYLANPKLLCIIYLIKYCLLYSTNIEKSPQKRLKTIKKRNSYNSGGNNY